MNLKQLSELLGLSQTTVSRALNGYPEVNEATRERVLRAVKETGYRPNKAAQRLATGKAGSIGLVMEKEDRDADDVAAPEARRLLQQAIGPFQPHHPHRPRRTRDGAGDEVEESAHRQHQARMIGTDIVVDPFFLQRRPHTDDQDIELLALDLLRDLRGIDLVEITVGNHDEFMPWRK